MLTSSQSSNLIYYQDIWTKSMKMYISQNTLSLYLNILDHTKFKTETASVRWRVLKQQLQNSLANPFRTFWELENSSLICFSWMLRYCQSSWQTTWLVPPRFPKECSESNQFYSLRTLLFISPWSLSLDSFYIIVQKL